MSEPLTTDDKWILEIETLKEYWIKAVDEIQALGEAGLTLPMGNAAKLIMHSKLDEIKVKGNILTMLGMPKPLVSGQVHAEIEVCSLMLFYTGYLMAKAGIELEKEKVEYND